MYHGINVYQDKILDDSVDYVMGALKGISSVDKRKTKEHLKNWLETTIDMSDDEIREQRTKMIYTLLMFANELGNHFHSKQSVIYTANLAKRLETIQDPVFKLKVKKDVILQT